MTEARSQEGPEEPRGESANGGERSWALAPIIAISAGVVVLIVAGVLLAIDQLSGDGLDALGAIPEDVDIVVALDLAQFTDSDRVDSLIQTFAEPMSEAGYIESSEVDLAGQLDQILNEEFDVGLEDDVLPWLGRSAAVGFWLPADLENLDDPDVVLSLSIRDEDGAAGFVEAISEDLSSEPFEDGTIYTQTGDASRPPLVWVGSDLLLVTSDRVLLREALAAREDGSMADDDTFDEAVSDLPAERLAIVYMGNSFFESVTEAATSLASDISGGVDAIEDLRGLAFSLSLPDSGVRFDVVQLLAEGAETPPIASTELSAVAQLPAETVGYFGFVLADDQVQGLLDQLRESDPEGYDETAQAAEDELGVDLLGEVLPSIGGEVLIAVVNERDGMLAEESGLPIGLLASLGLTTSGPLENLVGRLESLASDEGIEIRAGSPSVALADGSEVLAYEVTSDALVVGSSESVVEQYLAGGGGLTDTPLYQELNSELPGDQLAFFVDVERVLDLTEMSAEDRAIAAPLRGLGASYEVSDGSVTGSLLLLVDYLSD